MTEQITIDSVMTSYPYFIDSNSSINSARTMLDQYGVNHLPVKEGDKPVGVISRAELDRSNLKDSDNVKAGDTCSRAILVVERDKPLKEVLNEIATQHLECVLVKSHSGLEGIYTVSDACHGYADLLD